MPKVLKVPNQGRAKLTLSQMIMCPDNSACKRPECKLLHSKNKDNKSSSVTFASTTEELPISNLGMLEIDSSPDYLLGNSEGSDSQSDDDDLPPSYSVSGMPVLGEGSFGKVVRSRDLRDPSRQVAVKTIRSQLQFQRSHYCLYLYRELYMLRKLNHPNVITLLDVRAPNFNPKDERQVEAGGQDGSLDTLQLVFECADYDLDKFIRLRRRKRKKVTIEETKKILYQLLLAIKYVHSANIIHRDIKPENLLLWEDDLTVKLTDFGLARIVERRECMLQPPQIPIAPCLPAGIPGVPATTPGILTSVAGVISGVSGLISGAADIAGEHTSETVAVQQEDLPAPPPPSMSRHLTQHVVSRWYRAPEIILLEEYDHAVDVWSIGCVLGDLLGQGRPLFPGGAVAPLSQERTSGETDKNQLGVIFQVIGPPSEKDIESVCNPVQREYLRQFQNLPHSQTLDGLLPDAPPDAIDLLRSMLVFDKSKRVTVDEALTHPFLASVRDTRKEITMEQGLVMNIVPERSLEQKKDICKKIMSEIIVHRRNNEHSAAERKRKMKSRSESV